MYHSQFCLVKNVCLLSAKKRRNRMDQVAVTTSGCYADWSRTSHLKMQQTVGSR